MNVTLYCFVIATPNPKRFRYKIDPALWPNEPVATCTLAQVRVADELKNAGKFVRKASVRDLRRDRYDRSQSQADIVVVWHQYANLAFSLKAYFRV